MSLLSFLSIIFNLLAKSRRDASTLLADSKSAWPRPCSQNHLKQLEDRIYSRMNFNWETWKRFDVNVNYRCERQEFARVTRIQLRQPGVFQFRAEMFVRRADKITRGTRELSWGGRELVIGINFEISKILACRVEKKKVGDKRLPRQAANPPSPRFLRISCAHTKGTHTHTSTCYYRSVYRTSFSRKLMHGFLEFYSSLIVARNGARAYEIPEIRCLLNTSRKITAAIHG